MRMPADCILFDGIDITVNESIYNNGDELIMKKQISKKSNLRENPDTILLNQSLIMSGSGKAIVCAVGFRS